MAFFELKSRTVVLCAPHRAVRESPLRESRTRATLYTQRRLRVVSGWDSSLLYGIRACFTGFVPALRDSSLLYGEAACFTMCITASAATVCSRRAPSSFLPGWILAFAARISRPRAEASLASVLQAARPQNARADQAQNECAWALRVRIKTVCTVLTQVLKRCLRFAAQTSAVISTEIGPRNAPSPRHNKWTTGRTRSSAKTNMGTTAATTNSTCSKNAASSTSNEGERKGTGSPVASSGLMD